MSVAPSYVTIAVPVRKKRVSIKDVARAANVSYSTVSRALQNNGLVSPETRARVLRCAEKLNYSPNTLARGLVTSQTRAIGLVVTSISDPFIGEVVDGIEKVASEVGYSMILANGRSATDQETAVIELFRGRRVDGVLVLSTRIATRHTEQLKNLDVPIVFINNLNPVITDERIFSVSIDNLFSSRTAVEHLTTLGHKRVAMIFDPTGERSNLDRVAGYRIALSEAGLEPRAELMVEGDGSCSGGEQAARDLLSRGADFTALFCYNDRSAIGALKAIRDAGLRIPEDLSLVGFDDLNVSRYLDLTTVRQPKAHMGGLAMEILMKLVNGTGVVTNVVLPGELIVRGSTTSPRK